MAVIIQFPTAPCPVPVAAPVVAPAPVAPIKRTRGASIASDQRNAMLGKVHIAKKQMLETLPGFTEDTYRFILQEHFGVDSAATLEHTQLHTLLLHFGRLGWQAKPGRNRKHSPQTLQQDSTGMSRTARMEKIEAMLAEKGRVEGTDMPWGYAVGILKRQTARAPGGQVTSFDKASPAQLDDVIAALYRDAKRKGRRLR